jgi:hypothetical protein
LITKLKNLPLYVYLFFSFWIVYFLWFWSQIFTFDQTKNLLTRHPNVWGDWALHMTMGSSMAFRQFILDQSPILWDSPFRYSFLVNLLSAVLIRLGMPFLSAFTIPSFFLSLFLIFLLFIFYEQYFKSKPIAIFASVVFLFNGGFGFVVFIKDLLASTDWKNTILFPPRTYTNIEPMFIKWTSIVDTMLVPQRAFQLGFPLGILILVLIKHYLLVGNNLSKLPLFRWEFLFLF